MDNGSCITGCVAKPKHDSHCGMCGWGQYDLGNESVTPDLRSDDLSWCRECQSDICGACNCGHDAWGA